MARKPGATALVVGVLAVTMSVGSFAGPISELFLTSGDERDIDVVQGSAVVTSWVMAGGGREYPIAVSGGRVRTIGPTTTEQGAEYTTAGLATGPLYSHTVTGARFFDGTTDGSANYAWDFNGGGLYQFDLNWANPTLLFSPGISTSLGVTYDATNDSFWVSGWSDTQVRNYSRTGTLLSSFSAQVSSIAGLALDSADSSLWFGTQNDLGASRTLYQYSKTGSLLSTDTYAALSSQNFLGGEFEFSPADAPNPVPIPATLPLLGLGLLGLRLRRRA